MHPESCRPFRIGPTPAGNDPAVATTLTGAASYPSAAGIKPDRMLGNLDQDGLNTVAALQGGDAATFGTATLQRQYSFDGTNWVNDGAAVTAATPVAITLYRNLLYRWTVGGTGDITAARLFVA